MKRIKMIITLAVLSSSAAYAESVDVCGEIEKGCMFIPFDQYDIYYLPDVPQDLIDQPIRVRGELVPCSSNCEFPGTKCLIPDEIVACPPDTLGCGVLEPLFDGSCGVWNSPIDGRAEAYSYFGFASGDTVLAVGYIRHGFLTVCANAPGQLYRYELFPCVTNDTPVRLATWGKLKARFLN
jgi:hypothetical protein